jgi:hypothetical protein
MRGAAGVAWCAIGIVRGAISVARRAEALRGAISVARRAEALRSTIGVARRAEILRRAVATTRGRVALAGGRICLALLHHGRTHAQRLRTVVALIAPAKVRIIAGSYIVVAWLVGIGRPTIPGITLRVHRRAERVPPIRSLTRGTGGAWG